MKKRMKYEKDETFFDKIKKPVSDFFYDLSTKLPRKKKKNTSLKGRRTGELVFYYCLAFLPILHFLIFYVYVNLNSVILAFQEYKFINGEGKFIFSTLQIETVWNNLVYGNEIKELLSHSLIFYAFSLCVITPTALFFSYYIYKKYKFSEFFRVMLFVPTIISSLVVAFMYKFFIDRGVVEICRLFGKEIMPPLSDPSQSFTYILIYILLVSFGGNVIMYSSAMTRIPISVVEYAQIDGVGPVKEFFSMTLPLIYPTLSTFIIVGITGIFTNQANLYALYSDSAPENARTFGYHMFVLLKKVSSSDMSGYPYIAALGVFATIVVVPLTFFVKWVLDKIDPNVQY